MSETINTETQADIADQTATETVTAPVDAQMSDNDLRTQLEAANQRADDEHEAFLRARADFANFKRRTEEERDSLRSLLTGDLLGRLLPIADNFERALQAAEQTQDYEKLIGGVRGVYKLLNDYLAKEGVTPIDALHHPFDPNVHNAVAREESDDYPENTVVAELQKGYTLNGKVLRPTLVKVSTGE